MPLTAASGSVQPPSHRRSHSQPQPQLRGFRLAPRRRAFRRSCRPRPPRTHRQPRGQPGLPPPRSTAASGFPTVCYALRTAVHVMPANASTRFVTRRRLNWVPRARLCSPPLAAHAAPQPSVSRLFTRHAVARSMAHTAPPRRAALGVAGAARVASRCWTLVQYARRMVKAVFVPTMAAARFSPRRRPPHRPARARHRPRPPWGPARPQPQTPPVAQPRPRLYSRPAPRPRRSRPRPQPRGSRLAFQLASRASPRFLSTALHSLRGRLSLLTQGT